MRLSKLFTKTTKETPKDEHAKNAQLLIRAGFIDKLMSGVYTYLPLGLKVLNKIKNIVREEINEVGGQEILMPVLTPKENWMKTGRWDEIDVLFKMEGAGGKEYALGSTHEEIITPLVQKFASSYKDLPTAVYQIQDKFRNEPRAKSGLMRGREFSMKDLYSFHTDEQDLEKYYGKVKDAYFKIYDRVGIGDGLTVLSFATGGEFSKYSHEFQTLVDSGEDTIYLCEKCNIAINSELFNSDASRCEGCGGTEFKEVKSAEVGNIFKLKTKFTKAFSYNYTDKDGKEKPVVMGCYGIGPSRMMGTIVEVYADDKGLVWPENIAPAKIHLVSLGKDKEILKASDKLYDDLQSKGIEVVYDDRGMSAGEKLADADLMGIPHRVVISKKTLAEKKFELQNRKSGKIKMVDTNELFQL